MHHQQSIVKFYHTYEKASYTTIDGHGKSLADMELVDNEHASFDDMKHTWTIPREDGDLVRGQSFGFIIFQLCGDLSNPVIMILDQNLGPRGGHCGQLLRRSANYVHRQFTTNC